MRCESCGSGNAPENRFCVKCGVAVLRRCAACGSANEPSARFCAQCGGTLRQDAVTLPASEGELKQITVLFADISGSTKLIEDLDPEEATRRLSPAIEEMKASVRRFEGAVVRVQGDGIMAVFGAPKPQEDHAVRACCAALALQAAAAGLTGGAVPMRVGIHSGEVLARMVETDFATEFDAAGLTVHIASRLEHLAPEGGIVLSGRTERWARQFISVEPLGPQVIRGLSTPLEAFLLTGLRRGPTSQRFSSEQDRSSFLGREAELNQLERGMERAGEGDGYTVGVVAEAGLGKSRLCFEFAERCRVRGIRVLEGRALAHSRATPFEPVASIVMAFFDIKPDDPPDRARTKIIATLQELVVDFGDDLALLFDFLSIADRDGAPSRLDPGARRERLFHLFHRLVRVVGAAGPAVILLEDLHFLDFGSESLLEVIAESLAGTRLLLVANFRPGYAARWMHSDRYDQISLGPLRSDAAGSLAKGLLGDDASVEPLLPLISDRARGNPLFIEELVRQFHETGQLAGARGEYRLVRPPDMHVVPDTVQAIVGARIDLRPEPEKSILQTAAVVGRDFAVSVLTRLIGGAAESLAAALHRLSNAGLLYETGGGVGDATYAFRHPMVQDVAYHSLLSERRRGLHAAVASELENTLPDPNGAQSGFIAYHWEQAGNAMQAASYSMKAANWHGTRDPAQALDAWKRARRLLLSLPLEGPARYPLLMASGQIVNLGWREGLTATDVEPFYEEALGIARGLGDLRAVTLVTAAYGRVLAASGSADDYVQTVRDVLGSVEDNAKNASLRVVLLAVLCHALRLSGDLRQALEINAQALSRVDDVAELDQQTLGFNVAVWIKGMRTQTLALMGRFEEARSLLDELIAADEVTVDVLHRMLAHFTCCDIAWAHDDAETAAMHSRIAAELAEKSGTPYLLVYSRFYSGLAEMLGGAYSQATQTLSSALEYARRRQAGLEIEARLLADLAHVQLKAGLAERARSTAEQAAVVARRRGARIWLAYAEWLIGGPRSPEFAQLVEITGAELLRRLRYPGS